MRKKGFGRYVFCKAITKMIIEKPYQVRLFTGAVALTMGDRSCVDVGSAPKLEDSNTLLRYLSFQPSSVEKEVPIQSSSSEPLYVNLPIFLSTELIFCDLQKSEELLRFVAPFGPVPL